MLDSLSVWRKKGWKVGRHRYKIRAFAEVDFRNIDEVRQAIFSDVGLGIGVLLPKAAQAQMQTGQPWSQTKGSDAKPGSWGGHYVYICGYNPLGPVCVTWGRKQQMTWGWLAQYCDEAFAIFDEQSSFKKKFVDSKKIEQYLESLG